MADFDQEKRDKKFNLWARKYPAFVSLVFPLLGAIFVYFGGLKDIQGLDKAYSDIGVVLKVVLVFGSIIPALFFFYIFTIREVAMSIIPRFMNRLFEINTTKLLLSNDNTFSKDRKKAIKDKVREKYKMKIPETEKEYKNPFKRDSDYRQKVDEAVTLIREDTRHDAILFEYNCIYGFFRNLAGGMFLNLIILAMFYFFSDCGEYIELIKRGGYITLTVLFISLIFVRTSGKRYATRLYIVFLTI